MEEYERIYISYPDLGVDSRNEWDSLPDEEQKLRMANAVERHPVAESHPGAAKEFVKRWK